MPVTRTKTQAAYRQIKKSLLAGEFKPGEQFAEKRICEALGLSRGPVREALLLLHGEGLFRKQGAYGRHVVEYTEDIPPEQLLYRYELREQVAGGACRLAAKNMNGWQIDKLRYFAQRTTDSMHQDAREMRLEANMEFHDFLMEHCGNPLLKEVWESHHLMPPRPRSEALEAEIFAHTAPGPNHPSLVAIVDAIEAHDPEKSEQLMKQRVSKATEAQRQILHDHGWL